MYIYIYIYKPPFKRKMTSNEMIMSGSKKGRILCWT